jgi:ferredoxin-like protein FixX
MGGGKALWKYGMETCGECGACRYVCPVNAIDWFYPEAGTGIVLKYS